MHPLIIRPLPPWWPSAASDVTVFVIAVDDEGMSRRRASWRTTTASAGRRPWRAREVITRST
jgi:hypothetical protein